MKLSVCFAALMLWTSFAMVHSSALQLDSKDVTAIKAGATPYFTTKMENLTTKLDLNADQQAKLKPIAEQEANMLEQVRGESGHTEKEKIARLQQVVLDSDKQMKPWLSAQQWDKLQALRKAQKEQLKQYAKSK
jgi:hypothetical protein